MMWYTNLPDPSGKQRADRPTTWLDQVRQRRSEDIEEQLYRAALRLSWGWAFPHRSLRARLGRWLAAVGWRLQTRYSAGMESAGCVDVTR